MYLNGSELTLRIRSECVYIGDLFVRGYVGGRTIACGVSCFGSPLRWGLDWGCVPMVSLYGVVGLWAMEFDGLRNLSVYVVGVVNSQDWRIKIALRKSESLGVSV